MMLYQTFYSFIWKDVINMDNLENLFDEDTVETISNLVEDNITFGAERSASHDGLREGRFAGAILA